MTARMQAIHVSLIEFAGKPTLMNRSAMRRNSITGPSHESISIKVRPKSGSIAMTDRHELYPRA